MKLLIINQHMDTVLGGSEIQCDIIANNLIKLGVDVIYLIINGKNIGKHQYKTILLKRNSFINIYKCIKQTSPDIIYFRNNKKLLLKTSLAAKIARVKMIFALSAVNDVVSWYYPSCREKNIKTIIKSLCRSLISLINYRAFYLIDGVVSLQKKLLDKLPKRFSKDNTITIYNSMNIEITKDFKWNKDYIVWVSNIKSIKQPEIYIELAKRMQNYNIDFLMVGKIQEDRYKYICEGRELPCNLHYLGPKTVHEVDSIISSSLFVVHTCLPEGFGNIFIQSWLCGKPTISYEFDPDNLISENDIGYYCNKNMKRMVDYVTFLINNSKQRYIMGKKARSFSRNLFNSKSNAMKLYKFIEKIMS